ncbi:hypothetical protein CPB97_007338, partial [Podila verticillata]
MAIIHRCTHRYKDDDASSACTFECKRKPTDLRDDIIELKYKQSLLRKSPKQISKLKKQEQDARTIIVTNLDPTTSMAELKRVFMDFGRIYSASLSCSFGSKHSHGQGYAFLEFRGIETVNNNTIGVVKEPKEKTQVDYARNVDMDVHVHMGTLVQERHLDVELDMDVEILGQERCLIVQTGVQTGVHSVRTSSTSTRGTTTRSGTRKTSARHAMVPSD